ncbi:MAG: 3-dehydroquinate synthase family protein [Planctomycetota bacterium]
MSECRTVRVETQGGSYDVLIGAGLTERLGKLIGTALAKAPGRVFLVPDTGIPAGARIHAKASLEAALGPVVVHAYTPSETTKSIETLTELLSALLLSHHERRDVVVALGGGVTGDLAGFAASVYRRGCPLIQCPTTLLAMVDASVGGKTAVNLMNTEGRLVKNMAGTFYQPALVVADTSLLSSLTDRDYRCGLAECVKHGLIAATHSVGAPDPELLGWIEANAEPLVSRRVDLLDELVERNVRVKASIVAADERELASSAQGGRALLNLGHTFGHAIEPIPTLSPTGDAGDAPLLHGEAVSLGLICACAASEQLENGPKGLTDRMRALLGCLGLPTTVADLPPTDALLDAMSHDKKADSGTLRLVLPATAGVCRVVDAPARSVVDAGFAAIRA